MADQADERLRALKASMKEALGKLTGNDELEAQGARERSGGGARAKTGADAGKHKAEPKRAPRATSTAKKKAAPHRAKARPTR